MLKKGIMLIVLGLIFSSCDFIYYGKIGLYYKLLYNKRDLEISKISEKIAKANGFTKTCK